MNKQEQLNRIFELRAQQLDLRNVLNNGLFNRSREAQEALASVDSELSSISKAFDKESRR